MTDPTLQLVGVSAAMRVVADELQQAARSDAKILITGESGVGKEVGARMVHRHSARGTRPFVAINCAGVPDSLLESELFGHVRGSFTGAYRDKPGLLEQAHGGTIFMDEVGEMSLRMQALLLRFLEDGEIHRVGADRRSGPVNVRVIAATNRVLLDRIAAGQFREDLYYRLNVIHLVIPPLRTRREDIAPLLHHFIARYSEQYRVPAPEVSADALRTLTEYDWPGNVRELKNVVERFIVRGRGGVIGPEDLPGPLAGGWRGATRPAVARDAHTAVAAPQAAVPPAMRIFDRIVNRRESFWSAVYSPFMMRDLTREDVRTIIRAGLEQTRGNYKLLIELFNMEPRDYKRFLNFLRKHQCHMPFQQFRTSAPLRPAAVPAPEPEEAPDHMAVSV